MRRLTVLAGLLLAGGCAEPPGGGPATAMNAQQKMVAKLEAADRAWYEADPCMRVRTFGGIETLSQAWPGDCMDLLPAEVIRGVWFTGFEESGFIPDVDSVALDRTIDEHSANPEFDIDPFVREEAALQRMGIDPRPPGTLAFAITFVGRRSPPRRDRDGRPATPLIVVDAVLTGRLLGRVRSRACFRGRGCIEIP